MSTDRTVLVTGGSRGIGRACAIQLAKAGWRPVITYRSGAAEAVAVVADIESAGGHGASYPLDVADESAVRTLFRTIRSDHPPLGAVVSNAGVTRDGLAPMMSLNNWRAVIDTNLTGGFLVARETLKALRRTGGALVFVSSISGLRGQPGQSNYSASKGGLDALTRTLAREAAASRIRVNAVAPGFTDTDMVRRMPPAARNQIVTAVPLGRLADPHEIASVVCFLVGDGSSYITGQVISVDGGLSA